MELMACSVTGIIAKHLCFIHQSADCYTLFSQAKVRLGLVSGKASTSPPVILFNCCTHFLEDKIEAP